MSRPKRAAKPLASDHTGPRILAYLASMRRPRDCVLTAESDEKYHRGISVIKRMADSCEGNGDPTLSLSRLDCADVLFFARMAEPITPETWWIDPDFSKESHICGWMAVMGAVERAIRADELEGSEGLNVAQQSGLAGVEEQMDRTFALITAAGSFLRGLDADISKEDLGQPITLLTMAEEELGTTDCLNRIKRGTFSA